jgi:hypothetical protein
MINSLPWSYLGYFTDNSIVCVFMWTFDEIILSISKIEFFFFCDLTKFFMYIVHGITNVVRLCYSRHSLHTNIPFLFSMFKQKDMDL